MKPNEIKTWKWLSKQRGEGVANPVYWKYLNAK